MQAPQSLHRICPRHAPKPSRRLRATPRPCSRYGFSISSERGEWPAVVEDMAVRLDLTGQSCYGPEEGGQAARKVVARELTTFKFVPAPTAPVPSCPGAFVSTLPGMLLVPGPVICDLIPSSPGSP
jgi:hypothetical protein